MGVDVMTAEKITMLVYFIHTVLWWMVNDYVKLPNKHLLGERICVDVNDNGDNTHFSVWVSASLKDTIPTQ